MDRKVKIIRFIKNHEFLYMLLSKLGLKQNDSDLKYLKHAYKANMGRILDIEHPHTFNEKLNWLKLYDRKPIYTLMVDKSEAKKIAASIIGEEFIIPTIGVWDQFDDIDFEALPNQFVLKCTHDSGGLVICREKSKLDIKKARRKINKCLKVNYYWSGREWPYKEVKPRIIAEPYMQDGNNSSLPVYKFFNFNNGDTILQAIHGDKTAEERIDYFDEKWNRLDLRQNYPISNVIPQKPRTFEIMLQLGKQLSVGFPFLRTDFYEINGRVYFSEFTFYSDGGFEQFHPDSWDLELGKRIILQSDGEVL